MAMITFWISQHFICQLNGLVHMTPWTCTYCNWSTFFKVSHSNLWVWCISLQKMKLHLISLRYEIKYFRIGISKLLNNLRLQLGFDKEMKKIKDDHLSTCHLPRVQSYIRSCSQNARRKCTATATLHLIIDYLCEERIISKHSITESWRNHATPSYL